MTRIAMLMAGSAMLSGVVFARKNEGDGGNAAPAAEKTDVEKAVDPAPVAAEAAAPAKSKSIVPAGWKPKNDELSQFIEKQCVGKDGFEFSAFFELCRKNGLDATKVKHYEDLVASKAHGIQGRAKMTLRNMLATPARKNGKLIALDGTETPISIAKPAVSGAAAKAQEAAAPAETATTA